jgi:hypothetical protein
MLRFPVFVVLELPPQCRELVSKAKYSIWNHFWLHIVDALSIPSIYKDLDKTPTNGATFKSKLL